MFITSRTNISNKARFGEIPAPTLGKVNVLHHAYLLKICQPRQIKELTELDEKLYNAVN